METVISPKVFISAVPKNPLIISSQIFISVIDLKEKAIADTLRQVENPNKIIEKISADTFLKIAVTEKAVADTCRRMLDRATADTFRLVVRPEKVFADTVIRTPHVFNFLAQDSLANSFADYQATLFEVTLNERTLSDSFTLETARRIKINDAVQGTLLDYPYSFLVEERDWQDLTSRVKGMYDIDKLLYSFIEMDLRNEKETYLDGVRYFPASSYISKIAAYLNLTPNIKIEDFTPYNLFGDTNITYSDLISSLFSWTSRLPQRQINVFIRGGTLHCIQRGKEDSVFDISDIPHSRPHFNEKLIRSMYNNPFGDNDYDEEPKPFSGTISYWDFYSRNEMTYKNGLLTHEFSYFNNGSFTEKKESIKSIIYSYIKHKDAYYISHKKIVEKTQEGNSISESIIDTEYKYKVYFEGKQEGYYLTSEIENSSKLEGEVWGSLETTEKTIRQTFHSPIGNGWYSTTVYEDGEYLGSTISQGAPTNQVSQYTTQQMRKVFGVSAENNTYEAQRSRLAPIADTSFPVRELDLLKELTDDLKWLNRKIQVTVTLDLISKIENGVPALKHIVDFTERVRLDGVDYFLVSNTITFTPRSLIQKLQLVRWTE